MNKTFIPYKSASLLDTLATLDKIVESNLDFEEISNGFIVHATREKCEELGLFRVKAKAVKAD